MIEKIVNIRRVTKVVKGGRIFSISVLVVVGDGLGFIGIGQGKAKETALAVQKAIRKASKRMKKVLTKRKIGSTIGKYKATKVIIQQLKAGRGIIASSSVRAVLDVLGLDDVTVKCYGSTNPINVIKAVIEGVTNYSALYELSRRKRERDK
jgi:small subunit ribosomal protein S5